MSSSGYLTSWIFPKVSTKNVVLNKNDTVQENKRFFLNEIVSTDFNDATNKNDIINELALEIKDTQEFTKLKNLLKSIISKSGRNITKRNIAVFTNLNSSTNLNVLTKAIRSKLKRALRIHRYQVVNFTDLTQAQATLKTYEGVTVVSGDNMGRYFEFASKRQIILFGYNDIPKISNLESDLVDTDTLSSKLSNTSTVENDTYEFITTGDLQTPATPLNALDFGPGGSDGDLLLSLIHSPFKHTVYIKNDSFVNHKSFRQIFDLLNSQPVGLILVNGNTRDFLQLESEKYNLSANDTTDNLVERIGEYRTNIVGFSKVHKYALPLLDVLRQNLFSLILKWDRFYETLTPYHWKTKNETSGIFWGDVSNDKRRELYKSYLDTTDDNNKTFIEYTNKYGFINCRGERSDNATTPHRINNIVKDLENTSNNFFPLPPWGWAPPNMRGYTRNTDEPTYINHLETGDTRNSYRTIYPSTGGWFRSMLYSAVFKTTNTDTNFFNLKLFDADFTGIAGDSNSTKTIVYEIPYYANVDGYNFNNSLNLLEDISKNTSASGNFSHKKWQLSKSIQFIKQINNLEGDLSIIGRQLQNKVNTDNIEKVSFSEKVKMRESNNVKISTDVIESDKEIIISEVSVPNAVDIVNFTYVGIEIA